MRIGVIIPTRGDRTKFLSNCLRLISKQTLKPEIVELIDYVPLSTEKDITQRYRLGYDKLRNKGLDVIAFMEDDEWYSENYLQTMVDAWVKFGKPDLIGTNFTIYYHINLFAYFTMHHSTRSSAMSTFIKPDLNFNWCEDNQPFTDMHLWGILKGVTFKPEKPICLGIKHGVGLCGGYNHTDKLHRFEEPRGIKDHNREFLKSIVDSESFEFYANYFNESVKAGIEKLETESNKTFKRL